MRQAGTDSCQEYRRWSVVGPLNCPGLGGAYRTPSGPVARRSRTRWSRLTQARTRFCLFHRLFHLIRGSSVHLTHLLFTRIRPGPTLPTSPASGTQFVLRKLGHVQAAAV
jgi:hypothetical protein